MSEGAESYKDKETLERLYWDEGLSQAEIGERFGVTQTTIDYWMDKLGVETSGAGITPDVRLSMVNGYVVARYRHDYVYMHRLLAVSEYGFDAVKDKHVHHKNRVEWDNRPSNIELMEPSEHHKHHWEAGDYDDVVG